MILGSTPTHTFTFDYPIVDVIDVLVSYAQGDSVLVRKGSDDCYIDGQNIVTKLSQEDTLKFNHDKIIEIQIKTKDISGNVMVSDIVRISAEECIDNEVI